MDKQQFKKDLLTQRMFLKKELEKLKFISRMTGTSQEQEINKRLDRLLMIDKILKELENND